MSGPGSDDARSSHTAVLVHVDAPQLPFLASALRTGFTAVTRDGWSAVLVTEEIDPVTLAAAADPGSPSLVLSSDGETRELRVNPPLTSLDSRADWGAQLEELGRATTLRWEAADGAAAATVRAARRRQEEAAARHDRDHASGDAAPAGSATAGSSSPSGGHAAEDEPAALNDRPADGAARDAEETRTLAAVESIASLCDLDAAATARLENYARTPSSGLLLESVLQLLGLPVVAAKIVEGQRELHEIDGVVEYRPRGLGLSLLDSASVEPSGSDLLSRIQRAYVRRPGLLLALGGAELALGAGLAGLAARGGRSAKIFGPASALMFSDAAVQAALWASVRGRRSR